MRKLRYHERKLLKKVDFINWQVDNNLHESKIMQRYRLKSHEEYTSYSKLSHEVRELARKIKELDPKDPFRVESSRLLIDKCYAIGLIPTRRGLDLCDSA
ncbi:U3 small nucleolar ribonucleoprotein IMP3 [Trichinella patagoniensis]|uniref:U3 small nucleolar ribonucleoprotein IMP3 n=2 Tax=Trichinella TaxID=6333 RepID=A0A0V0ZI75_9BILA|nr:U3 small nucleolar ribonucleoprotein IMP3 [Trichinella patagoniensis]